jgi:hypothetical protein
MTNIKLTTVTKTGKTRTYVARVNGNPNSADGRWAVGGKYCGETITAVQALARP